MPGFPVFHHLLELVQTHVHGVGDAIHPSHPLSPRSPSAFNLSRHQGKIFQWVSSSHQVAKVLELQLRLSVLPMNIQDWFSLGWTGWISLHSKGPSRIFSHTTVQKHQFFGFQPSLDPTFTPMWRRQWHPTPVLLPGKIPWMEEPGRLQSMGSWKVGHDWANSLSLFTFMHWRKKWQSTSVFLPGESQGWEPGGLLSVGLHRVGHNWSDLAAAAAAHTHVDYWKNHSFD